MGKKTPAINSSSTADIAFLLLCYFLMTTTMGSQTGLSRRLPPMPDKNQKVEDQKVNRRNILQVKINSSDAILAGTEFFGPENVGRVKDIVKDFIVNPTLSEKELRDIEGLKEQQMVSKGVVSLQNDRGTSYKTYIAVQNELVKAFNEVREEKSMAIFGKPMAKLTEDELDILKKVVPQNISEAEPKDVKKK